VLIFSSAAMARSTPDGFADLAEKLLPTVVNISTTQVAKNRFGSRRFRIPQIPPGSPFEEFFRDFFNRNRPDSAPNGDGGNKGDNNDGGDNDDNAPRMTSLGSGFVIDGGYVITNNHVVTDAEKITVTFSDGSEQEAELVGRDERTDLAVLRVKLEKDAAFARFGDSTKARVGDWVLAIGNPYGLGGTVTAGIVSAKHRNINAGSYDDFIQVDAPINRGNSGGPLFNLDGDVIGINSMIFSPSGGSVGIGFSIPSSLARKVIGDLIEYGEPQRGWLGVTIQAVTPDIAESLGLEKAAGAIVASTVEGDPADRAGIKPGDVIVRFNNKDVKDSRALSRIVADTPANSKVPVILWRDGKRKRLTVNIVKMDEGKTKVASAVPQKPQPQENEEVDVLGMSVVPLTPDMRQRLKLEKSQNGVLVTRVTRNSKAAEVGIQRGDIIVEAAQTRVTSPGDLSEQIKKVKDADRKAVLLGLQRNGAFVYIAVQVGKG